MPILAQGDAPSDYVWALGSGLPRRVREAWPMVMLQAFIDDSGHGQEPLAMLAGFVAPAKAWASFSDEWVELLVHHKAKDPFKWRDARSRRDHYRKWTQDQVDALLSDQIALIKKTVSFAMISWVATEDFKSHYKHKIGKGTSTEYLPLFSGLFELIYEKCRSFGLEGRVDFFMDIQGGADEDVDECWKMLLPILPHDIRSIIGPRPLFDCDFRLKPLQAADIIATHARRMIRQRPARLAAMRAGYATFNEFEGIPIFERAFRAEDLQRIISDAASFG